ncbi:MAG: phosphonopyruvate decarboxylase [Rhodospirillaceae bacterium]|jgi:phosphonopyruvate decarboxylase|nr:phosphonopyruvate decarboxylase [Rhodospirillaceae bacterium]
MIPADAFLGPVRDAGFDFFTGVPCSYLTPLINRVISGDAYKYVAAASEGEAVAIASGAWLAGKKTVFMCQNSGLGNAVNPLTSLNHPFRIPTLAIVTWRGGPGLKDEPQHELMGRITPDLLDVIRVPHRLFPKRLEEIEGALAEATEHMNTNQLPFAFIMNKGDVMEDTLEAEAISAPRAGVVEDRLDGEIPTRFDALQRFLSVVPEAAGVIATTGKCGRELFTLADRDQHLYQVGSMGCAAAMGLGVALNTERPVVALDGDGAALMKLGSLATIGAYAPSNLVHVVLDNGTYDSTGGQPVPSGGVDFAAVGVACGYAHGYRCDGLDGFEAAVQSSMRRPGPHLIHMKILPGSKTDLGRPTIKPEDVARRFKRFLAS